MISANDFYEYYKKLSNAELIDILYTPNNYEPVAIEAAKKIVALRNLTDTEIDEARKSLDESKNENIKRQEHLKKIEDKLKPAAANIIETLSPAPNAEHSTEKNIRFIVLILVAVLLYQFIKYHNLYFAYLQDLPQFPFEGLSFLLLQLFLPVITFLFWRRKKIGWILLITNFIFSGIFSIWALFFSYSTSNFSLIDTYSPSTLFIQTLFAVGMIYALCKQDLMKVYSINNNNMKNIIAVSVLISIFFLYILSI